MANKKARVLVAKTIDGIAYKPNQVIDADADLIKQLVKDSIVCDDAKSVKYCVEQEGEKPILHQSPATDSANKNQGKKSAQRDAAILALQDEITVLEEQLAAAVEADKPALQQALESKQAELAAL